ncbi:MAG TPA: DivIVA domain-containing protein [Acidimicrobiales bacterium]|nr:DivIVA domain-containing protein [Acidimicrobiales bacterium]
MQYEDQATSHSDMNGADMDGAASVSATIARAAATIENLKRELEDASQWVERSQQLQAKEAELGRVILRAQEFAERASARAEERAETLIADARKEAERIVALAHAERDSLMAAGGGAGALATSALTPDEAERLRGALALFTETNAHLVAELQHLSRTLGVPVAAPSLGGGA